MRIQIMNFHVFIMVEKERSEFIARDELQICLEKNQALQVLYM